MPMAWDSERGGLSSRERTGAREEYSLKVLFALRRFLLGEEDCRCCWGFLETWLGFCRLETIIEK